MNGEPTVRAGMSLDDDTDATLDAFDPDRTTRAPNEPGSRPMRGGVLGRYVILDELGSGSMGIVFAAYDPQLDRRVALKLLHVDPTTGSTGGSAGRSRLLREAQAMARLRHPNVIAVHDVGTLGEQVFVAMDLVDGTTLTKWLAAERPWREIVATLAQAGEGLAAAHAAGIVHRDFKPDNVLVGNDGRVYVVDFGLARRDAAEAVTIEGSVSQNPTVTRSIEDAAQTGGSGLDDALTRTGAVLGTPAYMAPEQHLGQAPSVASDQFSFCVTLYRGLFGHRPFEGNTLPEIAMNVLDGRVREAPKDTRVPLWLRRVITQGLSRHPTDRYPSMVALLEALRHDPQARNRRFGVAGLGAAAVAAAVAVAYQQGGEADRRCESAGELTAGVWNDATRTGVTDAFASTGLAYAATAGAATSEALDAYMATWAAMYEDACEATHVRGEQSSELLDLRMECLRARMTEIGALATQLENADHKLVQRALEAAHGLSPISTCADIEALQATMPAPSDPALRDRVAELRTQLAESRSGIAGDYGAAQAKLAKIVEQARTLDYAPLLAESLELLGHITGRTAGPEAARPYLREANTIAMRIGHDEVLVRAATELVFYSGSEDSKHDEADIWYELADAALERLEDRPELEARLLYARGATLFGQARLEDAREMFRASLELADTKLAPGHPYRAYAATGLGNVAFVMGETDAALAAYQRSRELWGEKLGEGHPSMADLHSNIGNVHWRRGELAAAREQHEKALATYRAAFGEDSKHVANSLNAIATVLEDQRKWESALEHHRKALEVYERTVGGDHMDAALAHTGIGNVMRGLERYPEALAAHQRALEIREHTQGPEHPDTAASHTSVADVLVEMDKPSEAIPIYEKALAAKRKALGDDHASVAYTHRKLGEAHHQLGHRDQAIRELELGVKLYSEQTSAAPAALASARFALARALWDGKRGKKRALELAEQARAAYTELGEARRESKATVEQWLAQRTG